MSPLGRAGRAPSSPECRRSAVFGFPLFPRELFVALFERCDARPSALSSATLQKQTARHSGRQQHVHQLLLRVSPGLTHRSAESLDESDVTLELHFAVDPVQRLFLLTILQFFEARADLEHGGIGRVGVEVVEADVVRWLGNRASHFNVFVCACAISESVFQSSSL